MMHSDSGDDENTENCTPPNLVQAAEGAYDSLLPAKSKRRYERMYNEFEGWRKKEGASSLSERTLLAYFSKLAESNKPTTLWAYYSMLKSTLNVNKKVDISTYAQLTSFLKRRSEGYRPKKAKVFTEEEMQSFISEAPDDRWLVVKVACIFGLCGALRTDEFTNITTSAVKMYSDMMLVQIDETKNKEPRSFTVTGGFFNIVKKYRSLRPPKVLTNRFFVNYNNGKCTSQVVGKNKFSKMPCEIANYLELDEPEKHTGHAFRRTSATVVANTGATIETLKRHGGWKSSAVAEQYIEDSVTYKKRVGDSIVSAINVKGVQTEYSNERASADAVMLQITR